MPRHNVWHRVGTQWPIGINTVWTYLEGSLLSAIFLSTTASFDFSFAGIIFSLHSLTGGIFLSSVLLFYIFYFSLEVSSTSEASATTFRWLLSTFFLSSRWVHPVFCLLVLGCPKESWTQNIQNYSYYPSHFLPQNCFSSRSSLLYFCAISRFCFLLSIF